LKFWAKRLAPGRRRGNEKREEEKKKRMKKKRKGGGRMRIRSRRMGEKETSKSVDRVSKSSAYSNSSSLDT